jgi:hypothetical protein
MNQDLAEKLMQLVAERPDLMQALVRYVVRRAASPKRPRRRALRPPAIEPYYDFGTSSRAQRFCAAATGADRERLLDVATDVVRALQDEPGLSVRRLRRAVRELRGRCADGDVDAAVAYLGCGVRCEPGPRSARLHTLDFDMLPDDILERLERSRYR